VDIVHIVGLAIAATILLIVLKENAPQIAFLLSLCVGTIIFLLLIVKISGLISLLEKLSIQAHVEYGFLETVLKIIGIAYIAEFGAQIARDAGEGAIAGKVELAGKIFILLLAVPILSVIIETMVHLLP